MPKPVQNQIVHRNSENGRFVTERYAKTHKPTTEREVIKRQQPVPVKQK